METIKETEQKETINGREYTIRPLDISKYPNTARDLAGMAEVMGKRGSLGLLYTRKNGTRWVLWLSGARKEEVR